MTPLEGALQIARMGLPVFPCQRGSKEPLPGFKFLSHATTDEKEIRAWFAGDANACNYGVVTTGQFVIDCDVKGKRDGVATLSQMDLPPTLTVATPSGGFHLYYSGADVVGRVDGLGPGLDIRSHHNYVVGPGSVIDGRAYEVISPDDVPVAPVPSSLVQAVTLWTPSASRDINADLELDSPEDIEHARHFLEYDAEPAIEGEGGNATTYKTAQRVREMGLSEETTLELLEEHYNPRCEPEWSYGELAKIVSNAFQYGQNQTGRRSVEADFDPIDEEAPSPPATFSPIFAPLPVTIDPLSIAPRPWLAKPYLLRGQLTALVAPGGVGKSNLTLLWAIALGLQRPEIAGFQTITPAKVLIVNNEDDTDETMRRFFATCSANGIDPATLDGCIYSLAIKSPFTAVCRDNKVFEATQEFKHLAAFVKRNEIDVVVFDPFVEMHEADENSNNEMVAVMKVFRRLVRELNIAGVIVHHTRKPPAADAASYVGSQDAGRGASAVVNNCRLNYTLFPMTSDDAATYGIEDGERRRFIRIDSAKLNIAAHSKAPTWFELQSIDLPNGDDAPGVKLATLTSVLDNEDGPLSLVAAFVAESPDGVSLNNVVDLIKAGDPAYAKMADAQIRQRVLELLRQPRTVNGVTLTLLRQGKKFTVLGAFAS